MTILIIAIALLSGLALWLYITDKRRENTTNQVEFETAMTTQTTTPFSTIPETEIITRSTGTQRNLQADVAVPIAQAVFSGFVGALLGGTLSMFVDWDIWRMMLGGFVLGITSIWSINLWQSHRLLWTIEKVTRLDLDNDQKIGQPNEHGMLINPERARNMMTRLEAEKHQWIRTSDLLDFWTRCHLVGTSQRDHGIDAGSGAALRRYEEMRDTLFRLGLAEWKNPESHNAGWRVIGDLETGTRILMQHMRDVRINST